MKTIFKRIVIIVIIILGLAGTYWIYGTVSLNNNHGTGTSYADAFCLLGSKNIDGWITYSEKEMPDGKWYGGISNDSLVISCAQSKTLRTRVYIKKGAWDSKHWSGWAEAGEKSIKQVNTSFGAVGTMAIGAWYGYEAER